MVELLFLACLASSPTQCEQKSMVFLDVTPMQCIMGAEAELAKWVEQHPKYVVKYFACKAIKDKMV